MKAYLGDYPNDSVRAAPLRIDNGDVWRWHRDGTVTLWDVPSQRFVRLPAWQVTDEVMATLDEGTQRRLCRVAAKPHA